jgi:hypothetical protein
MLNKLLRVVKENLCFTPGSIFREKLLYNLILNMPTICKKDTCRNPAVYGFVFRKPLFCSDHREDGSTNTRMLEPGLQADQLLKECTQCSSKNVLSRFKWYCKHCYIKLYPLDPLSLQTVYKSKDTVIQKFIDSKFDGFVHKDGFSQIQINGITLKVVFNKQNVSTHDEKNIVIKFNPNKYENGKNPMLYTRLPDLEKEISRQFERIIRLRELVVPL